jgi:phospholipase C
MRAGKAQYLLFATIALAGCGGLSSPSGAPAFEGVPRAAYPLSRASPSPISHVVLIIQENRTFNDFFATFPGADGTTVGKVRDNARCQPAIRRGPIKLQKVGLYLPYDLLHKYAGYHAAYDHGAMDAFDRINFANGAPECKHPYQYTDPKQIQPYWDMADQYTLAEHMFTTQGSDSFTAHQDLIAGGVVVRPNEALIDFPSCSGQLCRWGCDAPAKTFTHLITNADVYLAKHGPFPCTNQFVTNPHSYRTLRDLLDAKGITWKYYVPPIQSNNGRLLSAFDMIAAVRYGPEWTTNVISPQTQIISDAADGQLAQMSWVIPSSPDSDHPGAQNDHGPEWVAAVVNAIGESQYWDSTAIVVVWDDWGGFYDNLAPQQVGFGGLGFRVPCIIISPYALAGNISTTNYEFGSILKYIEQNWNLGTLGTSDARATSILDSFDYSQNPISFIPIPSALSKEHFLHEKPSTQPPDTDF